MATVEAIRAATDTDRSADRLLIGMIPGKQCSSNVLFTRKRMGRLNVF